MIKYYIPISLFILMVSKKYYNYNKKKNKKKK